MRTPITTSFTPRTKPTTIFDKPIAKEQCITLDSTIITWDSTLITFDAVCITPIKTSWGTPRYAKYIEDMTGANITDLSGNLVVGISGNKVNKIDTILT